MALNYDPVTDRNRVFRFPHGNNLESLSRERPEDVLDIEEYAKYNRAQLRSKRIQIGTLFTLAGLSYTLHTMPSFKALNPLARSCLTTGASLGIFLYVNSVERARVQNLLNNFLVDKTKEAYEDPITVKYKDLTN
jgi:hypothetical protein